MNQQVSIAQTLGRFALGSGLAFGGVLERLGLDSGRPTRGLAARYRICEIRYSDLYVILRHQKCDVAHAVHTIALDSFGHF